MKEKTKTSWEHFCTNNLFAMVRKGMWHSELVLFVCTAEKARNLWGVAKGKQSYKRRHRADLFRDNFCNLNLKLGQAPSHTHAHKPEED